MLLLSSLAFSILAANTMHVLLGFIVLMTIGTASASSQMVLSLDLADRRQTIEGFGASDAWSIDPAIKQWQQSDNDAAIEELADWLFSVEAGIGLSLWRFNIGAGSAEQGESSGIPDPYRRAELLVTTPFGAIDASKQAGQIRMMHEAKKRGLSGIVAFANSPPVWATINGIAHPGGNDQLKDIGSTNLNMKSVDAFADALVRTTEYLYRDLELPVHYLSPINEATWHWTSETQEGNRYNMSETKSVYRATYDALKQRGLEHQIELDAGEVVEYRAALGDEYFKALEGKSYTAGMNKEGMGRYRGYIDFLLGDLELRPMISNKLSLHGYFSDTSKERFFDLRDAVFKNTHDISPDARLWMSEYAILGEASADRPFDGHGFDVNDMSYALHVARMMHLDLTRLDVTAWFWWLALTPYDYKDGLIKINKNLSAESMEQSKLFWTVGHFSRFVRPGFERLSASLADVDGVMATAFISDEENQLIIVVTNSSIETQSISVSGVDMKNWRQFVTDSKRELAMSRGTGDLVAVPPRSSTTVVVNL